MLILLYYLVFASIPSFSAQYIILYILQLPQFLASHFSSTSWLSVKKFLSHPHLIHSNHMSQPLHPSLFNIRYRTRDFDYVNTLSYRVVLILQIPSIKIPQQEMASGNDMLISLWVTKVTVHKVLHPCRKQIGSLTSQNVRILLRLGLTTHGGTREMRGMHKNIHGLIDSRTRYLESYRGCHLV